jgi:hypothetical protein
VEQLDVGGRPDARSGGEERENAGPLPEHGGKPARMLVRDAPQIPLDRHRDLALGPRSHQLSIEVTVRHARKLPIRIPVGPVSRGIQTRAVEFVTLLADRRHTRSAHFGAWHASARRPDRAGVARAKIARTPLAKVRQVLQCDSTFYPICTSR